MQIFALKLTGTNKKGVFGRAVMQICRKECEGRRRFGVLSTENKNILVPRMKEGNHFHFQQSGQVLLAETLKKSLKWFQCL